MQSIEGYLSSEDHHYKTGFHSKPLIIAWLPLVNFAVLCAAVKWCKYTFYVHVLLALGVITLTLLSTVHILVADWLSPNQQFKIQKVHNIAGFIVTIWMALQIISGILARVIQFSVKVNPNLCIIIKRFHHISSYLIMLTAKFNYLNIMCMKGKWGQFIEYFLIQLVFLMLYLWIKSSYWTLSQEIIDGQLVKTQRQRSQNRLSQFMLWVKDRIQNLKQQIFQKSYKLPLIDNSIPILQSENHIQCNNYVLFKDYVYNIDNLKEKHPGGQNIIQMVRKRQVDRFLYGYLKPQFLLNNIVHKHSKQSLRLCGQPIAKIKRISPFIGLNALNKVKIQTKQPIFSESSHYLVHIKPISTNQFKFRGYQYQSQIGRHFSLTIANKNGRKRCTRLYSTICCMRPKNLQFMEKHYFCSVRSSFSSDKFYLKQSQIGLNQSLLQTQTNQSDFGRSNQQIIPLIIKKYQNGAFTSRLLTDKFQGQIILSQPQGSGLKYIQLNNSGRIVFMCGGTGIFPFCDFIDLLFKRVKLLQQSNLSQELLRNDPIIGEDLMRQRQFVFLHASQNGSDLLSLTMHQLNYLCVSKYVRLSVLMRIKNHSDLIKAQFRNLSYQFNNFDQQIQSMIKEQSIERLYICGPPKMNQSLARIFKENNINSSIYHFM